MLNLSRKEIRTKIHELYKAAREPVAIDNKLNYSPKEFRAKVDQGYTWDKYVDEFPRDDGARFELPGIQRHDDSVKISSGIRYPRGLLDLVGANKDTVNAFNQLDQALADFNLNFDNEIQQHFLRDFPLKNLDLSKLDWQFIYRHVPRYQHHYVDIVRETLDEPLAEPTVDHVLELFDAEEEEIVRKKKKIL